MENVQFFSHKIKKVQISIKYVSVYLSLIIYLFCNFFFFFAKKTGIFLVMIVIYSLFSELLLFVSNVT